ncbi:MAG: addiction module toxin RelE [Rhodospirillales bacterium]|nr:addiction module toxin RelE [Rhodospirillales bacterium]MDH3790395.1 addiction module toxin RelE [Rhodospirillales bacterium]
MHTVVETPEFRRRVEGLLTEEEHKALVDHFAANPDAGDVMPGTGGARKARWAARWAAGGKGKSGGVRVISFYSGPPVPVFLLTVFGKGEKVDLTKRERNELRRVLGQLVAEYRKGARRHVQGR